MSSGTVLTWVSQSCSAPAWHSLPVPGSATSSVPGGSGFPAGLTLQPLPLRCDKAEVASGWLEACPVCVPSACDFLLLSHPSQACSDPTARPGTHDGCCAPPWSLHIFC